MGAKSNKSVDNQEKVANFSLRDRESRIIDLRKT
jgi:hypothetical protein